MQRPADPGAGHTLARVLAVGGSAFVLAYWAKVARAVWVGAGESTQSDWVVFFRAAGRAAGGDWVSVYAASSAERYPFLYPPVTLPLLLPLSELSPAVAYLATTLAMLGALGLALFLLRRFSATGEPIDPTTAVLCISGSAAAAISLAIGQLSPLFLLALVATLCAARRGRDVRAGLALSVLALKPTLGLLFPLCFGIAGRFRLVAAFLAATALWYGLSWAIDPAAFDAWLEALRSMAGALDAGAVKLGRNHTLWALLDGLAGSASRGALIALWLALVLPAAAALGWLAWRSRGAELDARLLGLFTLLTVAATPYLFLYDALLLGLPFFVWATRRAEYASVALHRWIGFLYLAAFVEQYLSFAGLGPALSRLGLYPYAILWLELADGFRGKRSVG